MRIALVDDDLAFRTDFAAGSVATLSASTDTFTCEAFLGASNEQLYDLVIIDPFAHTVSDVSMLLARARATATRVVILTFHTDLDAVATAASHRVDGYLLKSDPHGALASNIADLHSHGEPAVSPRLAPVLFGILTGRRRTGRTSRLTRRELDVLELVAQGRGNRDIAVQLGIAENTVKNHLHHILDKLRVRSRVGAVMVAVRDGMIDIATFD